MGASLKVKCATWDQVEAFYAKKLKGGRALTIKVPFSPAKGSTITLALGLPNDLVMAIDGTVGAVAPAGDGKRHSVRLELVGLTDDVVGRLRALVEDGRGNRPIAAPRPAPRATPRAKNPTEPPPPAPTDAPVDEIVEQPVAPTAADVAESERDVFLSLEAEHRRLRESAAHEVLGVGWDAGVAEIRHGYFSLTKKFHPDVYARHRSSAVLHLAQEVFIHINKAYDRMRDAAVAAGKGVVAGPALIAHNGWVAGFEDVQAAEPLPPPPAALRPESAPPAPSAAAGVEPGSKSAFFDDTEEPPSVQFTGKKPRPKRATLSESDLFGDLDVGEPGGDGEPAAGESGAAVEPLGGPDPKLVAHVANEARELMAEQAFEQARDRLAAALHLDARNRQLRALYHVTNGRVMLEKGMGTDATTQFETALRHDPDCGLAREALAELQGGGEKKRTGLFRKLFDK